MTESYALDALRMICALLDEIVYGFLIPAFYKLIMLLAEVQPFADGTVQDFATRVYSLLALFMLFKITFSFVTYIVNPDQMTDKTKGAANIVKNVIIVLILILVTPRAFSLLREAQSAILKDNVIPNFILGEGSDVNGPNSFVYSKYCDDRPVNAASGGDYLSLMIFRNFYDVTDESQVGEIKSGEGGYCSANVIPDNGVTVSNFLDSDIYNKAPGIWKGKYSINYWILISTIVGIIVVAILLTTCLDVALRAIKLGFLEIISPVPIISYLDPNSGKNGMFKNWLREVGKTWANLFIRLAAIYFAIYIIGNIDLVNLGNIDGGYKFLVQLLLIIGALMFAKQLPSLLETLIPGLKSGGGFQLNPFKKIENEALGGKQLLNAPRKAVSTAVGAGVAVGGLISANRQRKKQLKDKEIESNAAQYRLNFEKSKRDLAENTYNSDKSRRERFDESLRQKLEKGMELNEQDYKIRASLMQKEARAEVELNQATLEVDNAQVIADEKQAELDKTRNKNDVFSYNHPLATGFLQAFRGAKIGFDSKDATNIVKAVIAGIDAAKKATKIRNDNDKFGLIDKLKDLGSDISGQKNESGTTSLLKAKLKEQNDILTKIQNNIAALDHSFGNLNPGSIEYDGADRVISSTYNYAPGEKETILSMIEQSKSLEKARSEAMKAIKEIEDMPSMRKK